MPPRHAIDIPCDAALHAQLAALLRFNLGPSSSPPSSEEVSLTSAAVMTMVGAVRPTAEALPGFTNPAVLKCMVQFLPTLAAGCTVQCDATAADPEGSCGVAAAESDLLQLRRVISNYNVLTAAMVVDFRGGARVSSVNRLYFKP